MIYRPARGLECDLRLSGWKNRPARGLECDLRLSGWKNRPARGLVAPPGIEPGSNL